LVQVQDLFQETIVAQEEAIQFSVQLLQQVAVEVVIITQKLLVEVVQFNSLQLQVTLLQLVPLKVILRDQIFNLAVAVLVVVEEHLLQAVDLVELEETALYQDLQ
jgi:hypothetical protein